MIIIFRKDRPGQDPEIRVVREVRHAQIAFGYLAWWRRGKPDPEGFGQKLAYLVKRWTHIVAIGPEVVDKKDQLTISEIIRNHRLVA